MIVHLADRELVPICDARGLRFTEIIFNTTSRFDEVTCLGCLAMIEAEERGEHGERGPARILPLKIIKRE